MNAGLWASDVPSHERLGEDGRQGSAGAVSRTVLFEALFARYRSAIFAYVLRLLRNGTDAEDVTQETFLKLFLQLRRTPDLDARPWLYRVATNACIDLLRARGRTEGQDSAPRDAGIDGNRHGADPEGLQLRQEQAQRVQQALERLPASYQQVLVLRQMHDLSYAEIAEVLGISVEAVTSLLHRARLAFRTAYRAHEDDTGRQGGKT